MRLLFYAGFKLILTGENIVKIFKVKMLIPAVPFPYEWTVTVTDPTKALSKAKAQMRSRGLKPCRFKAIETEILSVREL